MLAPRMSLSLRSYRGRDRAHAHDFHQIVLPVVGAMESRVGDAVGAITSSSGAFIGCPYPDPGVYRNVASADRSPACRPHAPCGRARAVVPRGRPSTLGARISAWSARSGEAACTHPCWPGEVSAQDGDESPPLRTGRDRRRLLDGRRDLRAVAAADLPRVHQLAPAGDGADQRRDPGVGAAITGTVRGIHRAGCCGGVTALRRHPEHLRGISLPYTVGAAVS